MPKLTGNRIRDKLMKFFRLRPKAPQPTELPVDIAATERPNTPLPPPQLPSTIEPPVLNPHDIEPTSTKPEKAFAKGKSFERDMAILSIAYTLQESSELKTLIQLIVVICNNDSEGQVMSAMYHAYRFPTVLSFSLPKFLKPVLDSVFNLHLLPMLSVLKRHWRSHRSKSKNLAVIFYGPGRSKCLYSSLRTVAKLKTIQLNGDGKSLDELKIMINEDIERMTVSFDISVCPSRCHIIHTWFSLRL